MDLKEDSIAQPYTCIQCDWEESVKVLDSSDNSTDPTNSSSSCWISSHIFSTNRASSIDVYGKIHFDSQTKTSDKQFPIKLKSSDVFSVTSNLPRKRLKVQCNRTGSNCVIVAPAKTMTDVHPCEHYATCMDLSPDGQMAVSGSQSGNLRLWNPWNGLKAVDLKVDGHAGDITTCRFFPNGGVVISGSSDCMLKIWAVENPKGECAVSLQGHVSGVLSCDVVGRGRNVVSSSRDGTCKLWNCGNQKTIATFQKSLEEEKSGDAQRIAINHCFVMKDYSSQMTDGSMSPDEDEHETEGTLLVTSREDGYLCCFDIRQRKQVIDFPGCPTNAALNCSVARDKSVIVGSQAGIVTTWDLRNNGSPLFSFRRDDASITSMAYDRLTDTVWVAQSTGACSRWDFRTKSIVAELSGADCDPILSIRLNNKLMVASCKDNAIRTYHL